MFELFTNTFQLYEELKDKILQYVTSLHCTVHLTDINNNESSLIAIPGIELNADLLDSITENVIDDLLKEDIPGYVNQWREEECIHTQAESLRQQRASYIQQRVTKLKWMYDNIQTCIYTYNSTYHYHTYPTPPLPIRTDTININKYTVIECLDRLKLLSAVSSLLYICNVCIYMNICMYRILIKSNIHYHIY